MSGDILRFENYMAEKGLMYNQRQQRIAGKAWNAAVKSCCDYLRGIPAHIPTDKAIEEVEGNLTATDKEIG